MQKAGTMLISAKRNLHALIERFASDERAATAIEYALIASGIGAVLAATVSWSGDQPQNALHHSLDRAQIADDPPGFSPVGISRTPSASASRACAEPGRNGRCWSGCGAQPTSQAMSKVARSRPSVSAKRAA